MPKPIEVNCPSRINDIIALAITNYVDVAFPPGSAECSLVAREALLDAVKEFEQSCQATGKGSYNRRMRAMVREAIKLHYRLLEQDEGRSFACQCAAVTEACEGIPKTDEEIRAAEEKDNRSGTG